jgi:hypothetical protein
MENCTSFYLKFEIGQKKIHTCKELWDKLLEKWMEILEVFLTPDIIFSVMQKTIKNVCFL